MQISYTNLQDNWPNLFAMGTRMFQKRQTGSQQEEAHEGESLHGRMNQFHSYSRLGEGTYNQRQSSSAFGIDEEQSRNSEYDLNSTITKRRIQSLGCCVADPFKDG